MNYTSLWRLGTLLATIASAAQAQSSATSSSPAVPVPPANEVIELSPFTVNATNDKGYRAENTLAGSRLNTPLRDTAAPISVFTEEFLQDLAITNIDQLIDYTVGTQLEVGDSGPGTDANNTIGGANLIRRFDVRGVPGSESLDYFRSITPNDAYRVGRYDESRGPNGILFGLGSAGGLINQSSYLATTNRDNGRLSYQTGNYGTNRSEVRFNKVIAPRTLALAVAGLHQENGGWRQPDFKDKKRYFATLTFTPTDRITIRAMGERGNEHNAVVAPYVMSDNAFAWLDNRNARGLDAVTFVPTGSTPTVAQQALGVTTRNQATSSFRFVWVQNDGAIFNSAGTYLTGSYDNPAVQSPDGRSGVSGVTLRINDPSFLPYNINSAGPGMYRDQNLANYTFTVDWRITNDLNLNLAHNYQHTDLRNPAITGTDPTLRGEPNRTLGVNGPANPYIGRLYVEAQWRDTDHWDNMKETRLSLSYNLNLARRRWWLGDHRFAGMIARNEETERYVALRLVMKGAPFNADPLNQANRITTRVYVDENNPRSFVVPDWRKVPAAVTIAGRPYNVGWIGESAGSQNLMTTQELHSGLMVLQSYWLKRRLVTVFGYREDNADFISYGYKQDPATREDLIDTSQRSTESVKGITRTQGAVVHLRDWLSLTGNWSTNIGIPSFRDRLLPDGKFPPPPAGEGRDYGFTSDLLDHRLALRVVRFQTNQRNQTRNGGIDAAYNQRNIRIAQALEGALVGTGRPYTAADWAPIRASLTPPVSGVAFDVESEGYEVSLVANPTPNWRLQANYSYTDRIRTNTAAHDALPWYGFTEANGLLVEGVTRNANGTYTVNPAAFSAGGTVARWIQLGNMLPGANVATLVTSGGVTVAQEILDFVRYLNDDRQQEEQRWGLRPHKASMFTSYDFTEGRLRGFSIGGGYRWREANVIGRDASGRELRGRILSTVDLMLRYRHRLDTWRLRGTMTYQLNVANLLDRGGIMPQRFSSTADFVVPGGRGVGYARFDFIDPRSIRLTATYSF